MDGHSQEEAIRAMKVQDVILRAVARKMSWLDAAEVLGWSPRRLRRWRERYRRFGYDGLFDRRKRRPSPKRVPLAMVEKVLGLYRERYAGLNVRHFHEKLREEHQVGLSYSWVKAALQGAGLVGRRRRGRVHRMARPRREMAGMLVHCDGSRHGWIPGLGRMLDLVAYLDDATGECLYAKLEEEEGTLEMMRGCRAVVEDRGIFCSLYTDRAGHFVYTPRAGEGPAKGHLTQLGRALAQLGIEHIAANSPQARGRMERFFGTWQGRLPAELRLAAITTVEGANDYIARRFLPWFNRRFGVKAAGHSAFVPARGADLGLIFSVQEERTVGNDNTVSYGRIQLQILPGPLKASLARSRVRVCRHLDATLSIRMGPHLLGRYGCDGLPLPHAQTQRKAA